MLDKPSRGHKYLSENRDLFHIGPTKKCSLIDIVQ